MDLKIRLIILCLLTFSMSQNPIFSTSLTKVVILLICFLSDTLIGER